MNSTAHSSRFSKVVFELLIRHVDPRASRDENCVSSEVASILIEGIVSEVNQNLTWLCVMHVNCAPVHSYIVVKCVALDNQMAFIPFQILNDNWRLNVKVVKQIFFLRR